MSYQFIIILISIPGLLILSNYFINYLKVNISLELILDSKKINKNLKYIVQFVILTNILLLVVGCINNIFYHLNLGINHTIYSLFAISIAVYAYFFSKKKLKISNNLDLKKFFNKFRDLKFIHFVLLVIIVIYFFSVINRNFIYWNDQDEITLYGYFTRLYAQEWTLSDNIFEEQSRFIETLFSYFYLISENFILIRFLKTFLFIGLSIIFYILIFNYTKSISISLIGVLLFLLIPELSYVGPFSLKVDFMLFNFEILSIFFLLILLSNLNNLILRKSQILFSILSLGIIFSLVAVTTKLTSIYLLIVNNFIFIFVLIKYKMLKEFLISRYFFVIILTFFVTLFPQLIYKSIVFQNPLYPFPGFWMNFFEDPQYSSLWDNPDRFNVNLGIPIINEIYLLIYYSLGFSRSFYSYFNHFFDFHHPLDMGGTGWLSPVTLIIFLTPFYFKQSKDLIFLSLIFIFLFIIWKSNMQYVRVFLASSTLMIIAFCIVVEITNYKYILNFYKSLICICILIFSLYHVDVSIRNNPYFIKMSFNKSKLFEDNLVKSFSRDKWGYYIKNDIGLFLNLSKKNNRSAAKKISQNLFSSNDIDNINQIIRSKNKPIIINNIKEIEHFQTLINYGYIINDRDIILEKKLNYKNLCIIDSKKNIKQIYIECVN